MTKHIQVPISRIWVVIFVVSTLFCGLVYGVAQQVIRLSANNPQIQMAEDAALALTKGGTPDQFNQVPIVYLPASLASFINVYDQNGAFIAGNANLNGALHAPPLSALQEATRKGENILTWSPGPGVRLATVIVPFRSDKYNTYGYVVVGRSLRGTENLISTVGYEVMVAWVVIVILSRMVILW